MYISVISSGTVAQCIYVLMHKSKSFINMLFLKRIFSPKLIQKAYKV